MTPSPEPGYNPDVLSCIANLSNDEVFTPPSVANAMLDMLPQELFRDPNTTFLDPACKSGVFLREIAKRLLKGLEPVYPDLQKRIDHIFKHQLFGIAITELTAHLSRRSLYCSKEANSDYSVTQFDTPAGNVRFQTIRHKWENGKCVFCGASRQEYDREAGLETHAYEMIHTTKPKELFNMKFDVIIGNPPYQLSDGGAQASAIPIYNHFVMQAMKLNPRFLTMIIPARWFAGGRGLDNFRNDMLNDRHIRHISDYFNSSEVFPGVDISGGICYFLWDRDHKGDCTIESHLFGESTVMVRPLLEKGVSTYVRFNQAIQILRKIKSEPFESFSDIVSSQKPFGLRTYVLGSPRSNSNCIKIYSNRNAAKEPGYVSKGDVLQNADWVSKYKVLVSRAYGERGEFPYLVIGKPFVAEPNSCCSETYLVVGPYDSQKTCENVISYMTTKLFRFLVLLQKNTQDAPKRVYSFVPQQDFSKSWTDEELYAKYGISEEEITFIDSMIRPMEID